MPPSPASFVHFTDLPTEIRLQIWRMIPEPRVIEIGSVFACRTRRGGLSPVTFTICQESRAEAIKTHHRFTFTRVKSPFPYVWIGRQDILYLGPELEDVYLVMFVRKRNLEKVELLALASGLWPTFKEAMRRPAFTGLAQNLTPRLPFLKEVVFVTEGHNGLYGTSRSTSDDIERCPTSFHVDEGTILKAFEDEQREHPEWTPPRIRIVSNIRNAASA